MKVRWDYSSQYMEKIKNGSNHQADSDIICRYIEFPIEIPTFVHSKSRHGHGATQCSRGALPLALALPSALAATTPLLSHADHLARSWRLRSHFRGAFEQLLFIVNAQKNGKKEVTSCIYI